MSTPLFESTLTSLSLLCRGKVRDMYAIDDQRMLIVTTDRLSAFDVILPDPIPHKGSVLTSIANFWFDKLAHIIPNHLTSIDPESVVKTPEEREQVRGRSVVVKRLKPLPIEAVVRAYLIGSGWKDYQQTGAVCGIALPAGLRQADRLPEPIFTPATKAEVGDHDENISFADVERLIGPVLAQQVREISLRLYKEAAEYAQRCGIIIADTKFEFGLDEAGSLILIDEILTPDSSRFWPADQYQPGISPPSFDKQFIRDYLETLNWNKQAPGPQLPDAVIAHTAATYTEAYGRLVVRYPTLNPLLDFSTLPRFDAVKPDHITPAMTELFAASRKLIHTLATEAPATWQDFAMPLFDCNEHASRAWGMVSHLHAVDDSPEWRGAYNDNLPEVTQFFSEQGQNLALFQKFKAIQASPQYAALNAVQRQIIDNEIRDFRLSGAELPEDKKPRFQAIQEELASLSAKFSENVLDATNAFTHFIEDETRLSGLPEDVRLAARAAAEKEGKTGWKFTLHAPSYLPIMQYLDDRALREIFYRASATRASEFGPAELDNTPLMAQLLKLRAEEATLLGYKSYADVSLVPKMAESPTQVMAFLRELAAKAKSFAKQDFMELRAFAAQELNIAEIESWDVAYISEKLRERRYSFSEQEVKEYFPEGKVLAGLFYVAETLYDICIKSDATPTWHPDVRFFRVENPAGQLIGQFYLDLYARETKRGGAWMDDAITRRRKQDVIQTPVTYLTCNFSGPVGEKPAVFTHDEVITLFHEFGHGLHHLLTQVEELPVSGIHGVEWDAVELPSQFMENFCWEWSVLQRMTQHVDTGEPLPRVLFDKLLAAKNFQSGLHMLRQIEFSLFDLRMHFDFDPNRQSVLDLLTEVRDEVAVMRPPAWNRFPNSFSHIFAGGYAAGYYSYKWAEVLSADCYALFEEQGGLNPITGAQFLKEILSVGGSRPAIESFRAFRGRDPKVDALLKHSGMA